MSAGLVWSNLVAYSLQIGLLVGVAALAPAALRLRSPRARLAYWHLLLVACLLLPVIRPWRRQVLVENVTFTSRVIAFAPSDAPASPSYSTAEIALAVILGGVAARLAWLATGFWKLGRYRRRSQPFRMSLPLMARADLRLAAGVASPVTFGLRDPVILLPTRFPEFDPRAQEAILCHELLHVERRDWLVTVAEEVVRAAFWFHPAIWWLLGEIQLAREQAVDREVIERTQSKDEYLDALLAIAGARPQLDLAPAPLFLRKRHLKHRVVSILKEARMSKRSLFSALAASLCVLIAACWLVTNTFPLAAAPQAGSDSPGVTVDVGGAALLHRSPVVYPESARAKGVQGVVMLELTLDAAGNVADARAVSGPDELRKPALQSALNWHFARDVAGAKRQVTIAFQPPPAGQQSEPPRVVRNIGVAFTPDAAAKRERTIKSINTTGLSDDARNELLSKLPVRVGATMTPDLLMASFKAVREYDEHLNLTAAPTSDDQVAVYISPNQGVITPSADTVGDEKRIRVGGNVQSTKLIRQPRPTYPPEAKEARIQGKVQLMAVIAKDGTMKQLEVISGHPLLVPAALDAVKQWVYDTTLLNGEPVEVQTQIDVNFTLSQ
jgi:TonB family protein